MMKKCRSIWLSSLILTLMVLVPGRGVCAIKTDSSFLLPHYSKTVSLDFRSADLKDVLKALSLQIGTNFILDKGVNISDVTVFLEQVPVEEAMEMILSAYQLSYTYREDANTIVVSALPDKEEEMETRIYQFRYATVSTSKLLSTISFDDGGGESSDSAGSSDAGAASSTEGDTSAASGGIKGAIEAIIGEDGTVMEDTRTNSMVVTAPHKFFPLIDKTVHRLDVPVAQILIEIEMLDVSKIVLDQLGFEFSGNILNVSASSFEFPLSEGRYRRYANIFDFYKKGATSTSLSTVLEFLKTRTDTRSLARPRLLTLDNETAQIKIATDEAIGVTTSESGDTATTTYEAEREETGVVLKVTPQANLLTGEVTLAISPTVSEAKEGNTFVINSDLVSFKDPEKRSINVLLKAKSGQTVVIGGLLRNETTDELKKLPVLGDIPLIGAAFRHRETNVRERELLVVLTPHILGLEDMPQGEFTEFLGQKGFEPEQTVVDPRGEAIGNALDRFTGFGQK